MGPPKGIPQLEGRNGSYHAGSGAQDASSELRRVEDVGLVPLA